MQCIRRVGFSIVYAAFDVLIGPVAAAFLLSKPAGLNGIWLCYTLGEALALIGLLSCAGIRSRRQSARLSDYLFLDPDWEKADGEALHIAIQYGDDALRHMANFMAELFRAYRGEALGKNHYYYYLESQYQRRMELEQEADAQLLIQRFNREEYLCNPKPDLQSRRTGNG